MSFNEQYMQKPVLMSDAEANRLLGGPHATPEAVKAAFAERVKALHPDTAKLRQPGTGEAAANRAAYTISELKSAREVLLYGLLNQVQEIACKMCGGSGRVGTGFGAPCASCRGTGHQL